MGENEQMPEPESHSLRSWSHTHE